MRMVPEKEGQTPINPEELADLIPNLSTQQELNEWKRKAREVACRCNRDEI